MNEPNSNPSGMNAESTVKLSENKLDSMSKDFLNDELKQFLTNPDNYALIGIVVALAVIIVTILIRVLCRGSSAKRSVLMVCLSDSGKTLLFTKVIIWYTGGSLVLKLLSIKENVADYSAEGKLKNSVKLVDIPGHDKLRHQFVEKFKLSARGIIFVIDSLTVQKEIKDAAEFLYNILTDASINRSAPPLLIACNKQDQAVAKGAKLIQSLLEKELNTARISKSASLSETDGKGRNGTVYLGKPNQEFSFSDVRQFRVEFVECSARGGKEEDCSGITQVENWISKIA